MGSCVSAKRTVAGCPSAEGQLCHPSLNGCTHGFPSAANVAVHDVGSRAEDFFVVGHSNGQISGIKIQ